MPGPQGPKAGPAQCAGEPIGALLPISSQFFRNSSLILPSPQGSLSGWYPVTTLSGPPGTSGPSLMYPLELLILVS